MKLKVFVVMMLGIMLLGACSDDYNLVGPIIQPEEDKVLVYTDTFMMKASTVKVDAMYAKTTLGILGQIHDPLYGDLKADYMCQFYCPEDFEFPYDPIDGKIDSVKVEITYSSGSGAGWIGDSLTSMHAEVYLLNKQLERNFYSNVDPTQYYSKGDLLGSRSYTAYDTSISDSIREHDKTFMPTVSIDLPQAFGQKIFDEYHNNPSTFANSDAFRQFIPGVYITTSYGSGNLLLVAYTQLSLFYKREVNEVSSSTGNDTTYVSAVRIPFYVSHEVVQMNHYDHSAIDQLLVDNDEYTYLKSPGGVVTKLEIPAKEIASVIKGRTINEMSIALKAMPAEDWTYAMTQPGTLLLIPEDSMKTFFENKYLESDMPSVVKLSTADTYYRNYSFGNMAVLLKPHFENHPEGDQDLNLLVIPITRTTQSSYYYGDYTTSITNLFYPSGLKIRKGEGLMKLPIITTKYAND